MSWSVSQWNVLRPWLIQYSSQSFKSLCSKDLLNIHLWQYYYLHPRPYVTCKYNMFQNGCLHAITTLNAKYFSWKWIDTYMRHFSTLMRETCFRTLAHIRLKLKHFLVFFFAGFTDLVNVITFQRDSSFIWVSIMWRLMPLNKIIFWIQWK